MKTRLIIGLVLIAVGAGLFFFLRKPGEGGPPLAEQAPGPAKTGQPGAKPVYGSMSPDRDEAQPEQRLDVDDDPVGPLRIEGQVIDAEERPIGGATVGLGSHPPRTTRTEADGSFVFEKLVGRSYTLEARKGDLQGGPVTIRLTATKEPVTIRLGPAGGLEVTVVAAEDRKPVAGAEVEVSESLEVAGTTDKDGRVTLRGLAPGWQGILARAPGFAPAQSLAQAGPRGGTVTRHTIELRRGAAVAGRVVDAAGKPVAGARVTAASASAIFEMPAGDKDAAMTDAKGAWSFAAVAAGTFRFKATHEGHGPGASAPVSLDGKNERRDVVVTLEEGARIAGKVVSGGGEPVAGAAVRVVPGDGRWDTNPRQAFSDEKGGFEIAGLPRRKVDVIAMNDAASSEIVELDLAAKPEQEGVTITMSLEGAIAGIVVSPKGDPMPDVQVGAMPEVSVRRSDPSTWRLRGMTRDVTDSGGRFELKGLPEGAYRLRVGRSVGMDQMFQRSTVTAKTGDKDVRLVLEDDGKVKGKVLYADGTAPDTYFVATTYGQGTPFSEKDGSFEVPLPAGPAVVSVSGPSFVQKTVADVTVKGGETTDVGTINVEKGRSISGRVLGAGGAPVAGAKVLAGPQLMGSGSEISSGGLFGAPGVKSTTTGDDGGFVLAGVGAGSLVILADHPSEGRSQAMRLPAGTQTAQLDLMMLKTGSLEGVVSAGGKPVGGIVMASAQQATKGNFMVQSGDDGTYRFDRLAPDTYRVSAMKQGGMLRGTLHTKIVTVEPEKVVKLDIELPSAGVKVTLNIAPPAGTTVSTAQVILVSGKFSVANADEFNDRLGELGAGALHQGFILKGEPVKIENVEPGAYSACGIPIPGDINSPADMMKIRDKMDKLVVACQPATVTAQPPEQTITVKVPTPPPI